jgi:hypothetical protein
MTTIIPVADKKKREESRSGRDSISLMPYLN